MDSPLPSSPCESIPSLTHPPNAPEKASLRKRRNLQPIRLNLDTKVEEEEEKEERGRQAKFWTLLAESGHIRQKFLNYVPEDIPNISDYATLIWLKSCYSPSSQPHTFMEHAYCQLMTELIEKQIVH